MDTKTPSLNDLPKTFQPTIVKSRFVGLKKFDYELLYAIGDTVFYIKDNKISEGNIINIEIKLDGQEFHCACIYVVKPSKSYSTAHIRSDNGKDIFPTKQQLLDSL